MRDLLSLVLSWWSVGRVSYSPHGRQGIGVAQPQSGIDFPLVAPSQEIRYLLADAFLSYDDPADYPGGATTPFQLPYSIKWLYGLGNQVVAKPAWAPEPTHSVDVLIVDADERIIFDSTQAVWDELLAPNSSFYIRDWGPQLRIHEWKTEEAVCRIVTYTTWPPDGTPAVQFYTTHITPTNGVLVERVAQRLPRRVKSVSAVLDNLSRTAFDLREGYNMQLQHAGPQAGAGQRTDQQITFAAVAGAGEGIYPGCDDEVVYLRTINGVAPTEAGDFYLAATDCYWLRQPVEVVSTAPRQTAPLSELYPEWALHLRLGSDCVPCCPCDDYEATARYMNSLRDRYLLIGQQAADARDSYHVDRALWAQQQLCFLQHPVRVVLQPQTCPYLDVAAQFCNMTAACVEEVELTITLTSRSSVETAGVAVVPGFTLIRNASRSPKRREGRVERYVMAGEWPVFKAYWEAIEPGQSVDVRFRLDFPDCGCADCVESSGSSASSAADDDCVPYVVTAVVTAAADGLPIMAPPPGAELTEITEPWVTASATATAALNCPAGPDNAVDLAKCVPLS